MPGCSEIETQLHVFQSFCILTSDIQVQNNSVEYDDIFGTNINSQVFIANTIFDNLSKRRQIIPSTLGEGPEEPRREGGADNRTSASPSLVIRKAREKKRNREKQG